MDYRKYYECFEIFLLLSAARLLQQQPQRHLLAVFGLSRCAFLCSTILVESLHALLISLIMLLINFSLAPASEHYFFCYPHDECPFWGLSGRILLLGVSFANLNLALAPFFSRSYAAFVTFRISSIALVVLLNINSSKDDLLQIVVFAAIIPLSWAIFYLADCYALNGLRCCSRGMPALPNYERESSSHISAISSLDASVDGSYSNREAIIVLQDLTKKRGKHTALNSLSLSLYEKEIVALLGPNGSGKSTLVEVILGLLPQTGGSYLINERVFDKSKQSNLFGYCP